MSNKMQNVEEAIMTCWNVVDDIRQYLKSDRVTDDKMMNFLIGLEEIYEAKFTNLWNTYTEALDEYYQRGHNLDF